MFISIASLSILITGCVKFDSGEFKNSEDIVRFVEGGGDPNKQFFYKGNPASEISLLHFAALENDLVLVKYLVKAGASPDSLGYDGFTPEMTIFAICENLEERKPVISFLHSITDKAILDIEGRDIYQFVDDYWGSEWVNYLQSIKSKTPTS